MITNEPTSLEEGRWSLAPAGMAVLFTGLPCAGKTTIVREVLRRLNVQGENIAVLFDGDEVRSEENYGLTAHLGFLEEERAENVGIVARAAKIVADSGGIALISIIAPRRYMREQMEKIIDHNGRYVRFKEVFVDAPLEVCERRDVDGFYKEARAKMRLGFTGVSPVAPYEAPRNPWMHIKSAEEDFMESAARVYEKVCWLRALAV